VTTAPEVPLCDATAMTRFHRIFREALDAVPEFVGAAVADDDDRADLVGSYYANVLKLLHAHHEAEDLTIYPLMVERLPQHVDVISRVNAEHEVVLGTLGAAEQAVAAWRADPSSASVTLRSPHWCRCTASSWSTWTTRRRTWCHSSRCASMSRSGAR
jgi:hypothetical protein